MQIPEPGLRTHDRERATPGLTLFSPIRGDRVFLIDMDGQPVHEWKLQGLGGINRCRLTDDGNLFVAQATSEGPPLMAGKGGLLREYDWDGAIVWEHYDENHHHDARRLGNGNTLYIAWDPLDDATAGRVQGGLPGTEKDGKIYGDLVREIDPAGNTVWEWRIRDIEIEKFPFCRPGYPTEAEMARGLRPFTGWAINTRCLEGFDAANAPVKPIDRRDTPIEDVRASFDRNQGEFRPGP